VSGGSSKNPGTGGGKRGKQERAPVKSEVKNCSCGGKDCPGEEKNDPEMVGGETGEGSGNQIEKSKGKKKKVRGLTPFVLVNKKGKEKGKEGGKKEGRKRKKTKGELTEINALHKKK